MIKTRIIKDVGFVNKKLSSFLYGKRDKWNRRFERNINPVNLELNRGIFKFAEGKLKKHNITDSLDYYQNIENPSCALYYTLFQKLKTGYRNKYSEERNIKILIHIPPSNISPGGFSLFTNLAIGLKYIGVNVSKLNWSNSTKDVLSKCKPNILLTSDYALYLDKIDWKEVHEYRKKNKLIVGLNAAIQEYGNKIPLTQRLEWAKKNDVNFYYGFRSLKYYHTRKEYEDFFKHNYKIIPVEFGANVLSYFPVSGINRDLDFVFLGSTNYQKQKRYNAYFTNIVKKHRGVFDGIGWSFSNTNIDFERDKFIYARAKVGLNLHLDNQVKWEGEVNERTYMLAACGIPQLVDNPKIIRKIFNDDCVFIAETPKKYYQLFKHILKNKEEAQDKALNSMKRVMENYTIFHTADKFTNNLKNYIL